MQEPECLNLRDLYGEHYKIGHDESAATYRERQDPWNMTLLGERAVIYPYGGSELCVEIDYRTPTAKAVAAIPGVVVHQEGDHERTYRFHVDLFAQVAALVKPRKRRKLSEEQRAACAERLARVRPTSPTSERSQDHATPGSGVEVGEGSA